MSRAEQSRLKSCASYVVLNSIQDRIVERLQDCFGGHLKHSRYLEPRNDVKAFTLAEVLITLGVIGVVAAMTIPAINNAVQDAQFKTAYRKAFADANNAFKMAIANEESFSQLSSGTDGPTACINWRIFSSEFKKSAECISNDNNKCWASTGENSNGTPYSDANSFIDSSGVAWSMRGNCSSTATGVTIFVVDTNSFKQPNKYGKDRWVFYWTPKGASDLTPINVSLAPSSYYTDGSVSVTYCPSGGCLYRAWLMGQ